MPVSDILYTGVSVPNNKTLCLISISLSSFSFPVVETNMKIKIFACQSKSPGWSLHKFTMGCPFTYMRWGFAITLGGPLCHALDSPIIQK